MKFLMMLIYVLATYWYVAIAVTGATTYAAIVYGHWEEVAAAVVLGVLSIVGVLARFFMSGPQ